MFQLDRYLSLSIEILRKYLEDIQPWLHFRRKHNRKDYSIPVLDHTGKEYPDLINWTL